MKKVIGSTPEVKYSLPKHTLGKPLSNDLSLQIAPQLNKNRTQYNRPFSLTKPQSKVNINQIKEVRELDELSPTLKELSLKINVQSQESVRMGDKLNSFKKASARKSQGKIKKLLKHSSSRSSSLRISRNRRTRSNFAKDTAGSSVYRQMNRTVAEQMTSF